LHLKDSGVDVRVGLTGGQPFHQEGHDCGLEYQRAEPPSGPT